MRFYALFSLQSCQFQARDLNPSSSKFFINITADDIFWLYDSQSQIGFGNNNNGESTTQFNFSLDYIPSCLSVLAKDQGGEQGIILVTSEGLISDSSWSCSSTSDPGLPAAWWPPAEEVDGPYWAKWAGAAQWIWASKDSGSNIYPEEVICTLPKCRLFSPPLTTTAPTIQTTPRSPSPLSKATTTIEEIMKTTAPTTTNSVTPTTIAANTSTHLIPHSSNITNLDTTTASYNYQFVKDFCAKYDSRKQYWEAKFGSNATFPCSNVVIGAFGDSWWFCNEITQKFQGPEPDRTNCQSPWIGEVDDMLNDENTTALQVVDALMDNLGSNECQLFGGDLLKIVSFPDPLYLKQQQARNNQDKNFTRQMFATVDTLLTCDLVWGEVPEDFVRYKASSEILKSIDKVGFLFLQQQNGTFNFNFTSLGVTLRNEPTDQNSLSCFLFCSGTICVPNMAYNNTKKGLSVASAVHFNNRGNLIFPFFSSDLATNTSTIIGLSIDNRTSVDLTKGFPPVQITFFQVGLNFCQND